ncbi:MAG: CRTAC1 family protein [Planctomycetes bacterium]|nr:CRTAC1 family protein [Planctomycetota bacterium]
MSTRFRSQTRWRPATAFLALLILSSGHFFSEWVRSEDPADNYLEVLHQADARSNKFLNRQRAEFFGLRYRTATTNSDKFRLFHQSADEWIKAGDISKGLLRLDSLLSALPTEGRDQIVDVEEALRWSQMIGGLRLGEQQNCVAMHGLDSCLFPIGGSGVHQQPEGMQLAIENLDWSLARSPDRLDLRWLRNLASMALGNWPDGVPEPLRLSRELFASSHDVGRFRDVAPQVGIATVGLAGGASLEDFNGDGHLDLFVSSWGPTDPVHYFESDGEGQFKDRTESMGLSSITGGLNITHADYDNDGDADLLILRGAWLGSAGHHPNTLLRNDRVKFTDVTVASGLVSYHPTQTADWGDYDLDGDLDLFIGNESTSSEVHPCELFENRGDGTFVEVSQEVGLHHIAYVKGVAWGDIDDDGDLDLYLSTMASSNALYENLGPAAEGERPRFKDITARAAVESPQLSFPTWFWDYDHDGRLDILAGSYGSFEESMLEGVVADYLGMPTADEGIRLYRNLGDGQFEEVSEKTGIRHTVLPMGANFGDLDGDGWLDAYFGTGQPGLSTLVPNRMFRNAAGKRFEDVTTSGGFGHLQKGHGIAFGDIDHDGDQDIFATMGGAYEGDGYANILFENPGHGHHWLTLRLVGTRSSRDARHARVQIEVKTKSGPRTIHRVIGTGGSFGASSSQLEVGLGAATEVIAVTVRWPVSGHARYLGFSLDGTYIIEEGEKEPVAVQTVPFRLGGTTEKPLEED